MVAALASVPHQAPAFNAIEMPAVDGVPLAARHFAPTGRARGAVLVAGAMGVPQTFYAPFATWLAASGYHALTFDFRGSGLSRHGTLRGLEADIVTWARLDATAALRALQDLASDMPLTWIGHSLGGQIVPWVPDHVELAKIITVVTGSGYWRDNSPPLRRKVWLLWFVAAPLGTAIAGYFPGRALHMVGDLPRGVIQQWRRWCLNPNYAVGVEPDAAELFRRVTTPITALSFDDDEMMSARSIEALHACFEGAPVTSRRFAAEALGERRIGHFGFFKLPALWPRLLAPALASL